MVAALLPLVASCGQARDVEPRPAPITSPPATDQPSADPAVGLPLFPTDTDVQFDQGSGAWQLVFTDIRVGRHEGYDRVVLEFTGAGVPGWSGEYVDQARLEGSGDVVPLKGESTLSVFASHSTWPASGYYDGAQRLEPEGGVIAEVYVGGTFEGYTQVIVGVAGGARPFRILPLSDPPRLVIDIEGRQGGR
jgi:hypothetical protein